MPRNIERSPFESTPATKEDWLDEVESDLDRRTREFKQAKAHFEEVYASSPEKELRSQEAKLKARLEKMSGEVAMREKVSKGTDPEIDELKQARKEAYIELGVVVDRLGEKDTKEGAAVITEVGDETVQETIKTEAAKEAKEVASEETAEMDRLVAEGQKKNLERSHKEALATARQKQADDTAETSARAAAHELASIGEKHQEAIAAVNELRAKRAQKTPKAFSDNLQDLEQRVAEDAARAEQVAQAKKSAYDMKSARIRPESRWSRFKRSLSRKTPESIKQAQEVGKAFDRDVQKADKERAENQQIRNDLLRSDVISARKDVQANKPGFFARLFGRRGAQRSERAARYASNIEKVGGPAVSYTEATTKEPRRKPSREELFGAGQPRTAKKETPSSDRASNE